MTRFAMFATVWILLTIAHFGYGSICGYPGAPAHSLLAFSTDEIAAGTVATYECEGGFELLGPVRRTCEANGTWTPDTIPFCVLNVAAGKAPMQSSVQQSGFPQKAVDGSTSAFFAEGTCTQTSVEIAPWWYVNLLEPYMIQLVRIDFGRPCCPNDQPANIVVRVGNNRPDLGVNPICGRFTGFIEEGKPLFIPCSPPLPGAFVSIHMETTRGGILSICEAFVYTDQALPIESCPSFRDQPLGSVATFNGKCYAFHNQQPLTFDSARRLCMSRGGGSLVDEASPPLQGFISWELWRRHRSNPSGQYWMGAVRDPTDPNNWKWINGQDVSLSYWNLPGGNDNCSRYDGTKGWLWSDTDCNLNLNYICQTRPIRCGIPERPPNSTILTTSDDFVAGSMVEYRCASGHLLIGNSARTCQSNGFYTESSPTCKYLECGLPVKIQNGHFELINNTRHYESIVRYGCSEGHILMGEEYLTCDVQQTWNGPPPRCEPTKCSQPSSIENGSYRLLSNATTFGTVLEYICDHPGYRLSGASRLRCGIDGHWDNRPPKCTEVSHAGNEGMGISNGGAGGPPGGGSGNGRPNFATSTTLTLNPKISTTSTRPRIRIMTTTTSGIHPSTMVTTTTERPARTTYGDRLEPVVTITASTQHGSTETISEESKGGSSTTAHFIRPYFPDHTIHERIDSNNITPPPQQSSSSTTTTTSRPISIPTNTIPTTVNHRDSEEIIFAENPPSSASTVLRLKPTSQRPPSSSTSRPLLRRTTTTTTTTTTTPEPPPPPPTKRTTARPTLAPELIRPSPFIPKDPEEEEFNPFQRHSLNPDGSVKHPDGQHPPVDDSEPSTVYGHRDESVGAAENRPQEEVSGNEPTAAHGPSSDVVTNNVVTNNVVANNVVNTKDSTSKSNAPESEVQEDARSNTKLNLGGIIALSVFGGFVFLAAVTTLIVILCRRSRRSPGSLDNTTISTDDSLSSEGRGLNKYYKRAWENLRSSDTTAAGCGAHHHKSNGHHHHQQQQQQQHGSNLHGLSTDPDLRHATLTRQDTLDSPNYNHHRSSAGTIEGLRDTNEMTVNDATTWNTNNNNNNNTNKDRRHSGNGIGSHHHHHHHHHQRRSGSPDSVDGGGGGGGGAGHGGRAPAISPWQNKQRRH